MAKPIDRKAVDRLVVEHLPRTLRFAHRLTGDANTAEDVVQESLCRILSKWRTYRGEASFGTWMLQIVLNVDRDRRRKRRNFVAIPSEELASNRPEPADEAATGELRCRIRVAIENLPERQREVALLSFGEGLSTREVAEVLQITEPNVHTCLYLARRRIARAVGINRARQDRP